MGVRKIKEKPNVCKKGDKVRVIAGKDKGTEAVVLTALQK